MASYEAYDSFRQCQVAAADVLALMLKQILASLKRKMKVHCGRRGRRMTLKHVVPESCFLPWLNSMQLTSEFGRSVAINRRKIKLVFSKQSSLRFHLNQACNGQFCVDDFLFKKLQQNCRAELLVSDNHAVLCEYSRATNLLKVSCNYRVLNRFGDVCD